MDPATIAIATAVGVFLLFGGTRAKKPKPKPKQPGLTPTFRPSTGFIPPSDEDAPEPEPEPEPSPPMPDDSAMSRKTLQQELYALGYTLTPTNGASNANYRKALRAFQADTQAAENILAGTSAVALLEERGPMIVDGLGGPQVWAWVQWARKNQSTWSAAVFSATGHAPGTEYP